MSDKGEEALASELAALSVEEASAPPDGDGEKPSAEPAEGADPGGKITGVVSWFNVAKGFGARACLSRVAITVFLCARSRGAPSARARARRDRDASLFLCHPLTGRRARSRGFGYARAPRDSPRGTSPDTLVRCSYYARLLPLPNRRLRDARRRRRGRLRAPERRLQPGVPQLTESGAGGVRPRAHRRRAVQSRERASDPSPSESSHARRIEKHRIYSHARDGVNAFRFRFRFRFCFFREV